MIKGLFTNEREISLIDLYLLVKNNKTIFFSSIVLSLGMTFFIHNSSQINLEKKASSAPRVKTEYQIWIEIGYVHRRDGDVAMVKTVDSTVLRAINFYVPKSLRELADSKGVELDTSSVSVTKDIATDLILVKVRETVNGVDYKKLLISIAEYIINDHNVYAGNMVESNNQYIAANKQNWTLANPSLHLQPAKILQKPVKIVTKYEGEKIKESSLSSTIALGLVLGIFFGFFLVFLKSFIKEINKIEK